MVCFLRYGQLSGMVEPIAGLLGAVAVVLSFAAGAMVYVVVDDIIPEAQLRWVATQTDGEHRARFEG